MWYPFFDTILKLVCFGGTNGAQMNHAVHLLIANTGWGGSANSIKAQI